MAGIQGMPSGTKPADVNEPVPGATAVGSFDQFESTQAKATGEAASSFDQFQAQSGQIASAPIAESYTGPGSGALQMVADVAPTVGGIAGGIVGIPAGIPGIAAMGMTGAAAGMVTREFIEQSLLGKPKQSFQDNLHAVVDSAGTTGAELLAGEGVIKVAGKGAQLAMKTQAGQAIKDRVVQAAAPVVQYVSDFTGTIKRQIMKPVTDFLDVNMAKGTAEQSGDMIKGKFTQVIGDKFNQFKQSYAQLNQAVGDLPMADADKLALTGKLRADARGFQGSVYNSVKQYATRIDDAASPQQIHTVISDVGAEIQRLQQYQTSGAVRDKIAALQQFSDRAGDFMENFTHGIAKRVANGKASMEEMTAFEKMAVAQVNPTVPVSPQNLRQYAKGVAKDYSDDYIAKRAAIDTDYAKFRGFLEDVGEQTKLKAEKKGPMQFMRSVQDVPSEQLVERMSLPKNAAALREMQTTSPEVFAAVKQAKIRNVYNDSMTDGQINLRKLADNFEALPESSRPLIISDPELKQIRAIANSSNLKAIDRLADNMVSGFVRSAVDLTHVTTLAGAKIVKDAASTRVGRVISDKAVGTAVGAGKAYQGLSDTYYPKGGQ